MDRVSYKVSELLPLSLEQEANLQRLAALSDDDINLYDIPEVTDWSGATRHSMVSLRDSRISLKRQAEIKIPIYD